MESEDEGGSAARCCWGERWQGANHCLLSLSPESVLLHAKGLKPLSPIFSKTLRASEPLCPPCFAQGLSASNKLFSMPLSPIFSKTLRVSVLRKITLRVLRVSPKAQAQATNKPYMVFSEDKSKCIPINDELNHATGF